MLWETQGIHNIWIRVSPMRRSRCVYPVHSCLHNTLRPCHMVWGMCVMYDLALIGEWYSITVNNMTVQDVEKNALHSFEFN